ncbi:hypothetical protein QU487_13415 [Crenobacter sp. SG2305]|uniref:hypothetical protein n=1 Tax=Crenobacter oryzisoli TaxID=3056844 RepID=UPI0025AB2C79|nr:hypothetical protein [Crenobacter sp. SG2305]MDN0083746.1 hypothetical protein [Crenobacter sp. SG2305]
MDDEIRLTRIRLMQALQREMEHNRRAEQKQREIERLRRRIAELEARREELCTNRERWEVFQAMLTTKHKRICRNGLRCTPLCKKQPHEDQTP